MENYCKLGAHMPVKMHFHRPYLDYFIENCGDFGEKQSEHFPKTSESWIYTNKDDGMQTFWLTTVGVFKGMWCLLNTIEGL